MILSSREISEKYMIDENKVKETLNRLAENPIDDSIRPVLYAMSGKMGAGKDTIGDITEKELTNKGYEVVMISYSTPMKKEIENIVEDFKMIAIADIALKYNVSAGNIYKLTRLLDGKDIYERSLNSRNAIQYWGTEIRRKQDPDYWVNKLTQLIIENINENKSVYVSDVRFENEADSIFDLGGKIIRLEVDENVRIKRIEKRDNLIPTEEQLNHRSEIGLDDYKFDRIFDGNLSLEELSAQSMNYLLEHLKE